jgi:hypothetical protein
MKKSDATKMIAACALFVCAGAVFAHEGHGMTGSHWHATDIWGFLAAGGALTLMVWFTRGGK